MFRRTVSAALGFLLLCSVFALIPLRATAVDMHVSDACVELIKQLEGFTAVPKWDYSQWTVGFGTTCPDEHLERYRSEGIPVEEAEALLSEKLVYFDERVNRFISQNGLSLTQGQYDAIFSLTYNCGASWLNKSEGTLYQAIIHGATGNEFIAALSAWCTAGGSFLSGLMTRRLAEAEMYLYGRYSRALPEYYCYVKFDANGGNRSAAAQGYDIRYAAPVTVSATRSGYTFLGWYTERDGGTKVTALDDTHDRATLYAHWMKDGSEYDPVEPVTVTVTANVLNIRAGAGTGYAIAAQAACGDKLEIFATTMVSDRLWGQCAQGWICLEYTDYDLAVGGESAGGRVYATITAGAVNVRSGPGTSYSAVTTLNRGDIVEIFAQVEVDGRVWGQCEYGWFRLSGYAALETVSEETEPGEETPSEQEPTTPPSQEEEQLPTDPKAEIELPQVPTHVLILGGTPASVYNGPHETYPVNGSYEVGMRVKITQFRYFMGQLWGQSELGWICMDNCVMIEDETVLVRTFSVTVTTSSLYVRTEPSAESSGVQKLARNTQLVIYALKETQDGVWGRVYCGWICLNYTNYTPDMVPDQTPLPDCEISGHTYTQTVKAPTCTEAGFTTHTCTACGHSYTDAETPALGHSYADTVKAPTCTEVGCTTHTCTTCGHSYTDAETPALGHSYTDTVKAPTCTEAGCTTYTCTACGHSYTDAETPALGHSYTSVVTEPQVGKQGYTTHTCDRCGDSYTDSYTDPLKNTITVTVTRVYATVTAGAVNVRKGAGTGYATVTSLRRGTQVEILEQKTLSGKVWGRYDGGWFRLTGYATLETVTESYEIEVDTPVEPEQPAEPDRPAQPENPTEPEQPTEPDEPKTETVTKLYATVTAGAVNVRKGVGTAYGVVTTLRRGAVVEILEQTTLEGKTWGRYAGGWFRLSGYATLETVTEEVPTPEQPSESEKPTEPEQPSEPEKPTEPEQPTEPDEPKTETVTKLYATVTAGAVNVRKGVGTAYGVVTTLRRGAVVEILEQTTLEGKTWGRYAGGWFRLSGYATLETRQETTTTTTMTVDTDRLNVRSGAGTGNAIVDKLSYGTSVTVYEVRQVGSTSWARIEQGWVAMSYLK